MEPNRHKGGKGKRRGRNIVRIGESEFDLDKHSDRKLIGRCLRHQWLARCTDNRLGTIMDSAEKVLKDDSPWDQTKVRVYQAYIQSIATIAKLDIECMEHHGTADPTVNIIADQVKMLFAGGKKSIELSRRASQAPEGRLQDDNNTISTEQPEE